MTRFVLTIMALTFIAGCTPGIRISPAEMDTFSPTVREHIQKREVSIGMSQAAVRYAWGAPIKVNANLEDNSEVWVYTKFRVYVYKLTFMDGKLSSASSGVSVNRPLPDNETAEAAQDANSSQGGNSVESTGQTQTGPSADTEIQIEE